MALLDWIRRGADNAGLPLEVQVRLAVDAVQGLSPIELWQSQPAIRTVVGFLARNIAKLGLHVFERDGEDRRRLRDHRVARVLARPNLEQTGRELIYSLVADWALWDEAYLLVAEDRSTGTGWLLRHVPTAWVSRSKATPWAVEEYTVTVPGRQPVKVPAGNVIPFIGWSPDDVRSGASPLVALKDVMAEQIAASTYRRQVWERGERVGLFITRPADAPKWSDEARQRFVQSLREAFSGKGGRAGGAALLEDGMSATRVRFSAHEEQFVEAAKLAVETVARVFYINPTMIGMLDNANFSNVREFRRALFGDSLGWPIAKFEDRLNTFLVPRIAPGEDVFVEFNVEAQLRGSFDEQAQVTSTAVGAPWMTRNEARRLFNLPALDGGDDVVTPLNVLIGGQASPRDSAPDGPSVRALVPELVAVPVSAKAAEREAERPGRRLKAKADDDDRDDVEQVLRRFFDRQAREVLAELGAKAVGDEWWDEDRWNEELTADLYAVMRRLSQKHARAVLADVDLDPDIYDPALTVNYFRTVAGNAAERINDSTRSALMLALRSTEPNLANVFEVARDQRAGAVGAAIATAVVGFAAIEALKQAGRDERATKTWIVTSANPRPSHAAMDGETVPLDGLFSNGAKWPGDLVLGVDEVAGCMCDVEIYLP